MLTTRWHKCGRAVTGMACEYSCTKHHADSSNDILDRAAQTAFTLPSIHAASAAASGSGYYIGGLLSEITTIDQLLK